MKKLLNNLKHTKDCFIFFSDKKMFMVDPVRNHHNNLYMNFGNNMEHHVRYIFLMKHAATVMFLGLVCSNGEVSPPVLFDGSYQLDAKKYNDIMTLNIIPWMRKVAGKKKFVFQQNGAPTNMANKMQAFLKKTLTFGPSQCGLPRAQTLTPLTTVGGGKWRVVRVRLTECRRAEGPHHQELGQP